MHANENPLGASPRALAAARMAAESMSLYPLAVPGPLKAALAAKTGVPESQIVLGNGSDDLIRLLGFATLESPSDEVLIARPSFVCYYEPAKLAGCRTVEVDLDADWRIDLEAMEAAVTERTRLVYIANPNNPTSTLADRNALRRFVDRVADRAVVVLDEAYFEYAQDDANAPCGAEWLGEGAPIVVLRTFSKIYGLAGLRCGYAMTTPEIARALEAIRQPFNLNAIAQAAAFAALDDNDWLEAALDWNRQGLPLLTRALENFGAQVAKSGSNFVFATLGRPAEPVVSRLAEMGFLVRGGLSMGAVDALRVSLCDREAFGAFEAALSTLQSELPTP